MHDTRRGHVAYQPGHHGHVAHVARMQGGGRDTERGEGVPTARAAQYAVNLVAPGEQSGGDVDPGEAADSGHQDPHRLSTTSPSDAVVEILEAHHVAELRGGYLEDVGVLERAHAVPDPRRQVPPLPRPETHALARTIAAAHLQFDAAGEHADRLLLHAMVLQAERMPGADVQDLAHVAVGVGPDRLVPPWFRDVLLAQRTGGPTSSGALLH